MIGGAMMPIPRGLGGFAMHMPRVVVLFRLAIAVSIAVRNLALIA